MEPKDKIPVLGRIPDKMKSVVNSHRNDLPPWPVADNFMAQHQHYIHERQLWSADAPKMNTRGYVIPTAYDLVITRIYSLQPYDLATSYYLHGGSFIFGNLDIHDRITRLLARYTQCTVIGIDYSLTPEAHFPQAIEETAAACQYFHQHAGDYSLNVNHIGSTGDSTGAMLALTSALWLRDKYIVCGKMAKVLLWYGLYGLQDSLSRRLMGGAWGGLIREGLQMHENAYLHSADGRESSYYCLFNNDLTRDAPPCLIAGAEFDPLINDSRLLFQTLQAHQQPYQYKMYPGTLRTFLHYSRMTKITDDVLREGTRYFGAQPQR